MPTRVYLHKPFTNAVRKLPSPSLEGKLYWMTLESRDWLLDRGESPFVRGIGKKPYLEFKDPDLALIFKLTYL